MKTKYVEIRRTSEYANSYTTPKAAQHMLENKVISGFSPISLKEIKARRLHHFKEEHYFRMIAEEEFRAKYHGKRYTARVIDGGKRTEMLVSIIGAEELHLQTIYACNIKGKKTWYPETACVYYETGQEVEVEIQVTHGFERFVIGLTPGYVDQEHWDRIKDQNLAFRCDEEGKATTGLLAKGAGLW